MSSPEAEGETTSHTDLWWHSIIDELIVYMCMCVCGMKTTFSSALNMMTSSHYIQWGISVYGEMMVTTIQMMTFQISEGLVKW